MITEHLNIRGRILEVREAIAAGSKQEALRICDLLVRDLGSGFSFPAASDIGPLHEHNLRITSIKRHWKSQRFHDILDELKALHDRKQKDYGSDSDPFLNVSASQDWNISPVVGALLRMTDKVRRLQSWVRNGNLANEGAEDSMRDISVYAAIALVLHEVETGQLKAPEEHAQPSS